VFSSQNKRKHAGKLVSTCFRVAAAFFHDFAFGGALTTHFLRVGEQWTVNFDTILVA
jgi:hypothetical protein